MQFITRKMKCTIENTALRPSRTRFKYVSDSLMKYNTVATMAIRKEARMQLILLPQNFRKNTKE